MRSLQPSKGPVFIGYALRQGRELSRQSWSHILTQPAKVESPIRDDRTRRHSQADFQAKAILALNSAENRLRRIHATIVT
jgi:hypothetical protein